MSDILDPFYTDQTNIFPKTVFSACSEYNIVPNTLLQICVMSVPPSMSSTDTISFLNRVRGTKRWPSYGLLLPKRAKQSLSQWMVLLKNKDKLERTWYCSSWEWKRVLINSHWQIDVFILLEYALRPRERLLFIFWKFWNTRTAMFHHAFSHTQSCRIKVTFNKITPHKFRCIFHGWWRK